MKQKYIEITHLDDSTFLLPIIPDFANINKPLNHPENIGNMVIISRGYCPYPSSPNPVVVPASQIKYLKLIEK